MSDFRCCTQEFVSQFIDLYRSEPCLWKVKSKEYSDRTKKSKAYGKLVEKMREVDPGADRETVTKKINSLRCAFRKELKKVEKSRKIAISPDDVYVPHLWYYNQLGFLIDQENDSSTSDVLSPDMIEKVK